MDDGWMENHDLPPYFPMVPPVCGLRNAKQEHSVDTQTQAKPQYTKI